MRREVELSRRRSIKLKAQVDKLQESRDGPGWSQHRERVKFTHRKKSTYIAEICSVSIMSSSSCPSQVTEEVLSVLRLLHPLTESESSQPEPSHGENQLDAALAQLQNVARKLAISHTQQVKATPVCTHIKFLAFIISLQSRFALIFSGHVTERNVCFSHTCG